MHQSTERSCRCGRESVAPTECCLRCEHILEERSQLRARAGRSRYVSAERPSSNTLPASRNDDYRRSLDLAHLQSYRGSGASAAFTHAFSSDADVNNEDDVYLPSSAVDMFPKSFYRQSSRTSSRASSSRSGSVISSNSGMTPSGRSPLSPQSQPSEALAQPVTYALPTRDSATRSSANRGYSPMAAGFARLSNRTAHSTSESTERTTTRDASARMFAGPA